MVFARRTVPPPAVRPPLSNRAWAGIAGGLWAIALLLTWTLKPSAPSEVPTRPAPSPAPGPERARSAPPQTTAPPVVPPTRPPDPAPAPLGPLASLKPLLSIPLPDPAQRFDSPLVEVVFEECRARFRYEGGFSELYDMEGAHLENEMSKPPPLQIRIGEKTYYAHRMPPKAAGIVTYREDWAIRDEGRDALYESQGILGKPMGVSAGWSLQDDSTQFKGYVESISISGPRTIFNELLHLEVNGRLAPAVRLHTVYREGRVESRGLGALSTHEAGGKTWFIAMPGLDGSGKMLISESPGGPAREGPVAAAFAPVPGRSQVVAWRQRQIQVVDLATGKVELSGEAGGRNVDRVLPSPDGRRLALHQGHQLRILDAATLRPVFEHAPNGGVVLKHAAWCGKGDHLLFGHSPFQVWEGSGVRPFPMQPGGFNLRWGTLQLAATPDGGGFLAWFLGKGATPTLEEWRIDERGRRLIPVSRQPWAAAAIHPPWILGRTSPQSRSLKLLRLADRSVDHEVVVPAQASLLLSRTRIVATHHSGGRRTSSAYDCSSRQWEDLNLRRDDSPAVGDLLGLGGEILLVREQPRPGRSARTTGVWKLSHPPSFVREVEGEVAALSPGGGYLIRGATQKPRIVESSLSGKAVLEFPAQPRSGFDDRRHGFSPGERWVAVSWDKLLVGDLKSGKLVAEAELAKGYNLLFFLAEDRLAVVGEREFRVYSMPR